HRRRVSTLPDRLGPLATGEAAARAGEWGLIENAEFVVVPDRCVPALRALVVVKGGYLLPTDMPEAALRRLRDVVGAIAEAFRQVTGAPCCRTCVRHPDDLKSRRLHLFVEPDTTITDPEAKRALWGKVLTLCQPALTAQPG